MRKITIVTPANIEVEYYLAGVGSRLGAFLIDFIIQLVTIALGAAVILVGVDRWLLDNRVPSGGALGTVMVLAFVIFFGYFILCEMLMNGRTLGKKVFGLRAIRDNGQPLQFSHSLIRGLFRASIDMIYIGVFVIMFSQWHKRTGDMAAGTLVVNEKQATVVLHQAQGNILDSFEALFTHANAMTPTEKQVVNNWLHRREGLPDGGQKIKERLDLYFEKYNTQESEDLPS